MRVLVEEKVGGVVRAKCAWRTIWTCVFWEKSKINGLFGTSLLRLRLAIVLKFRLLACEKKVRARSGLTFSRNTT